MKVRVWTIIRKARNHCQDVDKRGDEDHCQDVDKRGDEDHCQYHFGIDHCQYHFGIDHCQTGNPVRIESTLNGNEHSDR